MADWLFAIAEMQDADILNCKTYKMAIEHLIGAKMVDEAHLWKMLSEDDEEMKCSMFHSSAAKFSEPDGSVDESGQFIYPSNLVYHFFDFLWWI